MGNQFWKEWHEKYKKELYDLQYVTMNNNVVKHVTEFEDKSIDKETYGDMRMNSYAQDLMFAKMNDELLIERAEYFVGQCDRYCYPSVTYNEAAIHVIIPELIKRLQEKSF